MPMCRIPLTTVDKPEVRRYAGMASANDFPEVLLAEAIEEGLLMANGKATWQIFPYDPEQGMIVAPNLLTLQGQDIRKHLAQSTEVAVLAATIGGDIGQAIDRCFADGEYTKALLLDAVGTAAVETVADGANRLIEQEAARRGLAATWRYSPGYGDWDVTVQPELIVLAAGAAIGLTVTSHAMLKPRKSVTALIGLSPRKAAVTTLDNTMLGTPLQSMPTTASTKKGCTRNRCDICGRKDCLARKGSPS
ncbi:methionine synthase [Heliophilum fasciatum]|uniref:Cobalamin-dependent methionine synthase-like protein n=1 Tax=Heliophilum fasciatum TaxID=35700 RepID=A0A4R2RUZ5_9FIRM|nr:methionine synthase [Heliophilum fasciatum]MCW2277165.1 hypothetical protein [Heliophilum fasciatum]TCP68200.1 hypothetical protein EDD73_104103 [Heliophilum fasciatum]